MASKNTNLLKFPQINQDYQIVIDESDIDFLLNEKDDLDKTDFNLEFERDKEYKEIQLKTKQKVLNLIEDIRRYTQYSKNVKINKQTQFSKTKQSFKTLDWSQTRRYCSSKKFISRHIYSCGACLCVFSFKQELFLHIQKQHSSQTPDGTIFGLKKEKLFKIFDIPYVKPVSPTQKRVFVFKCGCGKEYNCQSLLSYHIKSIHNSIEPIGTIGIVRNIKIHEK